MSTEVKFPDVHVELTGQNSNALIILSAVRRALRTAGHSEQLDAFTSEAMSGDYNHLLQTCMRWVDVS